jgi:hypothetical protein
MVKNDSLKRGDLVDIGYSTAFNTSIGFVLEVRRQKDYDEVHVVLSFDPYDTRWFKNKSLSKIGDDVEQY